MKLIKELYTYKEYNDGTAFESMNYPEFNYIVPPEYFFKGPDKILNIQKKIIYEDGGEYILPVANVVEVITDRTGFIVKYGESPHLFSQEKIYPWFFDRPNNAAIYNAEGTLRHQLILPNEGFWSPDSEGWYIHSTYYADFPNLKGWGVMVTNDLKWPDLCFCLYDGTPNLVWTKYSQERR